MDRRKFLGIPAVLVGASVAAALPQPRSGYTHLGHRHHQPNWGRGLQIVERASLRNPEMWAKMDGETVERWLERNGSAV